ncbi:MAG: cardiolipin synthase [Lachnospiraceae bacterium]|nr:cardiolipin synthase [Lachnospiraceae bacterium]
MEQQQSAGLRLWKKSKQGLISIVFSRLGLIVFLFFINFGLMFLAYRWFAESIPQVNGVLTIIELIMIIYLFNCDYDSDVKLTWLIVIMIFPLFGSLFLLYTRFDVGHRAIKHEMQKQIQDTKESLSQDPNVIANLREENPESFTLVHYVGRTGCYPVYDNTEVTYLSLGEDKLEELLKQLEAAKHFIFLEYFIVEEGIMWGKVLEILARKAKEGVEVRMLYDGSCEFTTLPHDYPKRLHRLGIQCKMFAPLTPFVSTVYNYRDHRKILVIDGHTAFTGGINLADEYINVKEKYGHWKDASIMLKGEAAKSFTLMFLQMWNCGTRGEDYSAFLRCSYEDVLRKNATDKLKGYVLPYGDSPLDHDKVGERIYMDILNQATEYVHIMSPYLILDEEMEAALQFAAERGIDVKIILPGIPDKKGPNALAKTHYKSLLTSGVKIYEYTPGFIHSKVFVSDDKKAVVGTINLDYRSFYHHFECAAYMYGVECISDVEKDFCETLEKCSRVTFETIKKEKLSVKIKGSLLKALAPLI